ncbi:MAG: hypothetical protein LBR21_02570 [Propionibacteriaceae bacterium]|jgi:hypothetical protein|nr:hypothetical protein [Propionibacteriaceae bacterium]
MTISTQAAQAREAARHSNGQFGETKYAEALFEEASKAAYFATQNAPFRFEDVRQDTMLAFLRANQNKGNPRNTNFSTIKLCAKTAAKDAGAGLLGRVRGAARLRENIGLFWAEHGRQPTSAEIDQIAQKIVEADPKHVPKDLAWRAQVRAVSMDSELVTPDGGFGGVSPAADAGLYDRVEDDPLAGLADSVDDGGMGRSDAMCALFDVWGLKMPAQDSTWDGPARELEAQEHLDGWLDSLDAGEISDEDYGRLCAVFDEGSEDAWLRKMVEHRRVAGQLWMAASRCRRFGAPSPNSRLGRAATAGCSFAHAVLSPI